MEAVTQTTPEISVPRIPIPHEIPINRGGESGKSAMLQIEQMNMSAQTLHTIPARSDSRRYFSLDDDIESS
jgi:hypothetical protein